MRFLHTADWHVGKKLGRISRTPEFEAVLEELVEIAVDQKVDAVLVAGDLWDRTFPPLDSIQLVVDALIRLAEAAGNVVAIPGNHDSPALFGLLARLLEPRGVVLAPSIVPPSKGGVITLHSRDGRQSASVGVFPFLHEARVIEDLMGDPEEWYKGYSDRVRRISQALVSGFEPAGIGILMAHYFIEGAEVGGGERKMHMGEQYTANAHSIPPGASYVALGHVHRPQQVPGAPLPAWYSGSLLPLDFSERTHTKNVVIVDIKPGLPAKAKALPLRSGRRLIRVTDELDALRARSGEFGDAYLDVRVKTSGPVFGLVDEVRRFLPNAVMVQAVYERAAATSETSTRSLDGGIADLYSDYHSLTHGVQASSELLDAVKELEEELMSASS
jgi:exonuclease SbcD